MATSLTSGTLTLNDVTIQEDNGKLTVMPINSIYVQYSGQSDPNSLFGGTWRNISNQFAAQFFRAEGSNGDYASGTFGGDPQEDKIRNIKGTFNISYTSTINDSGAFSSTHNSDDWNGHTKDGEVAKYTFNANSGTEASNPMAGHADGTEIRPYNSTIRIWKRTA